VFNAKNDFKKLYMKPSQTFYGFYSSFLQLSGRAQIALPELKYELYNKLSFDPQRQVITQPHAETLLKVFADHYGIVGQSLKAVNEKQNKTRATTRTSAIFRLKPLGCMGQTTKMVTFC
jgi:hypothetical protein